MPPARASYLLVGVAALVLALGALTLALRVERHAAPDADGAGSARHARSGPGPVDPVTVLREWDRRRAEAWATGDPAGLRPLYAPGATAGAVDRAMLRRYAARGLRVEGLAVQRLAVRVLRRSEHRLVLQVTDRVSGAQVVGRGLRVSLPRDGVSTRVVTLRHPRGDEGQDWVVVRVRRAGPVRPGLPR